MIKKIPLLIFTLILSFSSFVFAYMPPSEISNVTNHSSFGFQNGAIETAQFRFPTNIALSEDGIIYISDTKNHQIRAIGNGKVWTITGKISKLDDYGIPIGGLNDGKSDSAMFNEPKGIVINRDGLLYVADSGNNAIRVITPDGMVKTLINDLHSPSDVIFDQNSNLYISDTLHHQILKYSSDGELSTFAGGGNDFKGGLKDGLGTEALFNEPTGLAIDQEGVIYVADTGNQRIRKISKDGLVTTIAGSGSELLPDSSYIAGGFKDGYALEAQFNFPQGVAIATDNSVYVADSYNHRIRKISPVGEVTTIAGVEKHGKLDGFETVAQFDIPTDLVFDHQNNLLVVDQLNHTVRKIAPYQLPTNIEKQEYIQIVINNQLISFDVNPTIIKGRTILPVRQVGEALGYTVTWNEEEQMALLHSKDEEIKIELNNPFITGDVEMEMDVTPYMENGRIMIPLRFIAEAFGLNVSWISEKRVVLLRN